jgi:hypothetical protein
MMRNQARSRDRCGFVSDSSVLAESSAVTNVMFVCWFGVAEMVWVPRNPQSVAILRAPMDSQDTETCSPKAGNPAP